MVHLRRAVVASCFLLATCSTHSVDLTGEVIVRGPCDAGIKIVDGTGDLLAEVVVEGMVLFVDGTNCTGRGRYAASLPERDVYSALAVEGVLERNEVTFDELKANDFVWHLILVPTSE